MTVASSTPAERRPAPLSGFAAFVANLTGLRAGLLSFAIGVVGSFGQAPFHLWPLTMAMVALFVWQIDGAGGASGKRRGIAGFWRGYCLGFGYFLAGLWWVGSAFLVDAEQFGALMPLAVTALPAGLALFWGLVGMLAAWTWRRDWRRIVLLATIFFVVEYVRGHVLTGFPWNLVGQVWPAGGAISQSASVIGVYGLTFLTLVAFGAPAALAAPSRRYAVSLTPAVMALTLFVVLFALGHARLISAVPTVVEDVRLRIVQAQIDQAQKWIPANRMAMLEHYLRLSVSPGIETRTHILWAEAALPVPLLEEPRMLDSIARTVGDGRVLLTGLWRRDFSNPERPLNFNSFAAIAIENGTPLPSAIYDKVKLVPFGEYTPFVGACTPRRAEAFLTPVEEPPYCGAVRLVIPPALIAFANGYTHGPGRATVTAPGAPPLAPQICFEVVFPGFTPRGEDRPGWIVNVTNDSWYKGTPGPYQLYNQARYRAIEEGLPLARAASGGVSALVDPYGRAVGQLAASADDVIDADLPAALRPPVYSLLGDAPAYLLAAAGLFVGLTRRRSRP